MDREFVTAANAALCQPKKALHRPTTEGHDRCKRLWEENHRKEMFLDEAANLCLECHRLAPFRNFNGNTFAAIARSLVNVLKLRADQAHVVRSLNGHAVAGTASELEVRELRKFSRDLPQKQLKGS